jgi:hypothetical protein
MQMMARQENIRAALNRIIRRKRPKINGNLGARQPPYLPGNIKHHDLL